jgi:hypothetical protein
MAKVNLCGFQAKHLPNFARSRMPELIGRPERHPGFLPAAMNDPAERIRRAAFTQGLARFFFRFRFACNGVMGVCRFSRAGEKR